MNVLVRGLGTIGTTVANLLLRYREPLAIDRVMLHKTRPQPYLDPDVAMLAEAGAHILTGSETIEQALSDSDYVFDCRKAGAPRADQEHYLQRPQLLGVCAQGTEHGFGPPFVTGINDSVASGSKLIQIASCNTHAIARLLHVLTGEGAEPVIDADFVVVRRCEDIGSHERMVSGCVVARHADADAGTHHAVDTKRLFATTGASVALTSSDITTQNQLMHAIRFAVRLGSGLSDEHLRERMHRAPMLAQTDKFDANRIFELGRRYGFQGRIYDHAIIVSNNLLIDGPMLRGWAFVPQEGNTLLSTLDAFLLQTQHPQRGAVLERMTAVLTRHRW